MASGDISPTFPRVELSRSSNPSEAALQGSLAVLEGPVVAHQVPPSPNTATDAAPVVNIARRLVIQNWLRDALIQSLVSCRASGIWLERGLWANHDSARPPSCLDSLVRFRDPLQRDER